MEEFDDEFAGDFEEVRDEFAGDWEITTLRGYSEAELRTSGGEPARITFWEDDTGELVCGDVNVGINVRYGETLEGLPAMTFKRRSAGQKRGSVSGLGAIRRLDYTLAGSLTIGGRARAFTAKKLP